MHAYSRTGTPLWWQGAKIARRRPRPRASWGGQLQVPIRAHMMWCLDRERVLEVAEYSQVPSARILAHGHTPLVARRENSAPAAPAPELVGVGSCKYRFVPT